MQDNLNTHKLASLYEAFPPEEARRLINKLEVHYTPKHGSWLNMAEIELGVVRGQCLDRRIPDFPTLTSEVAAWQSARNAAQVKVDWQFTTADARVKLKRLYPILEPVKTSGRTTRCVHLPAAYIKVGGETIEDFVFGSGLEGDMMGPLAVYARAVNPLH